MKRTYVYFVKEKLGENAPIKIGVAVNVRKRLKTLQTGNPRALILLGQVGPLGRNEAYNLEEKFHHKFRRFHIRGEWFSGVVMQKMHWLRTEIEYVDWHLDDTYEAA